MSRIKKSKPLVGFLEIMILQVGREKNIGTSRTSIAYKE